MVRLVKCVWEKECRLRFCCMLLFISLWLVFYCDYVCFFVLLWLSFCFLYCMYVFVCERICLLYNIQFVNLKFTTTKLSIKRAYQHLSEEELDSNYKRNWWVGMPCVSSLATVMVVQHSRLTQMCHSVHIPIKNIL